jgi:prepilin-type N-terminal cleavage/methylation domain-containing protein
MRGKTVISTRQGLTMIELTAAMVIVGVAVAMTGVSFMSFERIGQGINARNAQLAQQRLELILAEKRNVGFPDSGESYEGPDPCQIHNLNIDACDDDLLTVQFKDKDNEENLFCRGNGLKKCEVKITVVDEGTEYIMLLFHYN